MTYKDAVEVLNKYYTGRKDRPGYPDFDDIHEALYLVNELLNEHLYFEKTFEQHIAENFADSEFVRLVRHQVCEEIRQKLNMNQYNTCENTAFNVHYDYLKEILDQIE